MNITVGTRGSKLALIQTQWVIDQLKIHHPEINFEIKVIKTKGDKIQHLSLDKIGDKGLFVKEIETQLINGDIDMAIHSMKDMPSFLPDGLKFASIPKREDPRDVLILKKPYKDLTDLPVGARIGTGSKRRKFQLLEHREDLNILPIRGNIDTRIRKMEEENLDGIVLAAAGVLRAGLGEKISCYLDVGIVVPAPAQGALAIEIRDRDIKLEKVIESIRDEKAEIQVAAERGFLEGIEGSCHIPMGAYCSIKGGDIKLIGLFGDEEGKQIIVEAIDGDKERPRELGLKLSEVVLEEFKTYAR